jgi:acetylglutamate kinase
MSDVALQAEILNQALPYIQRFRGQTFVVKLGGSALGDPKNVESVIRNVLLLHHVGIRPVLVHGGGPEIDHWLGRLGMEKRQVDGLRVTDESTMEVVEMVLSGRANKVLVGEVQRLGGLAAGLSGRDGGILHADILRPELGRVGEVTEVRPALIEAVSQAGFIPVLCSVAEGEDGGPINVNADTAASALAVALGAGKLILMTDTEGVRAVKDDPSTRISHLSCEEAEAMIRDGRADRGMIPKLQAAVFAAEHGVDSVHLIHAGTQNALLIEVFTDEGIGTMLTA